MDSHVIRNRLLGVLLACSLICLWSGEARAWWNEEWSGREKITIDTTTSGADIHAGADEVPVLVRLHTGNIDFTRIKEDGSDIRFVSSDDKAMLKHHIELLDITDEMALIWVRVPKVAAASKADFIWMYYDNKKAPRADDTKGTYDKNYVAVFHFAETEGMPKDSTGYGNNASAFSGSLGLPAIVGKGVTLGGGADKLVIQSNPSLDISGGFTYSSWIRANTAQADAYLLYREEGDKAITIGIDKTRLYCRLKSGREDTLMTPVANSEITLGQWHHVVMSAQHQGKLTLYIDGKDIYGIDLSPTLPNLAGEIVIGNDGKGGHGFAGDLDELTISNTARSKPWVQAQYSSQSPKPTLLSYGAAEAPKGGGMLEVFGYLVIVFKNTTISGWSIIAITLIILGFCIVLFIDKLNTIRNITKANDEFMPLIEERDDYYGFEKTCGEYPRSPVYRIFKQGCHVLNNRMRSINGKHIITPKVTSIFRNELEKGALREGQKLNSGLILLTIGITGGPFLGLLGTVWGVMNTFAAMAQVGEANIMAIAPGIASALACTLTGLILAIPALFAYNYLTTKIKDIMADVYLFVDEFTINVEANYTEDAQRYDTLEERRIA